MKGREYQIGAFNGDERGIGLHSAWNEHRSALVQMPTGSGKTWVAAQAAKETVGRVLFTVHLREILFDAVKEFRHVLGEDIGLELASSKSSKLFPERVICGSVQTLSRGDRLLKFNPEEFSLVIFDESHHSTSSSWKKINDYFPNAKVLNLTATPERADGKKLGEVMDSVAYQYTLQHAIEDGWLVAPRQRIVKVEGLDFSEVPRKKGDLSQEELSEIMCKVSVMTAHRSLEMIYGLPPNELSLVPENEWDSYIGDRRPKRTLAFCCGVEHARQTAAALNSFREGLCGFVAGDTEHEKRKDIFKKFKSGELPCLANCGVTTEGYNNPFIEVILMLRPTLSKPLFMQMIGRASRTLPGLLEGLETAEERRAAIAGCHKPFAEIVDFTGNSGKHRLISLVDIFAPDVSRVLKERVERRAEKETIDIGDAIEKEKQIIEEEYRRSQLEATNHSEVIIDGFTGKRQKKKFSKEQKEARRIAREKQPIGDKQWAQLTQQKLHPENRSFEENKQILKNIRYRYLAKLCTYRQGFTLMKYGYTKDQMERMSFREASAAIDRIAKNGWRRVV
jgi:superfamily II DNA or RNA helicase